MKPKEPKVQPEPGEAQEHGKEGATVDRAAELEQRVASLEEQLLRARADFQNLQKRAARERLDAISFGNAELMRALLGVLDDFDRSVHALDQGADSAVVLQGVRLVHQNFRKTLTDCGLEEIQAKGRAFDPTVHEALVHQPTKEHAAGTVIDVLSRGYKLRDRVVRPARVVVAKGVEPTSGKEEGSGAASAEAEPAAAE